MCVYNILMSNIPYLWRKGVLGNEPTVCILHVFNVNS